MVFDIVIPEKNPEEFLSIATRLGYKGLVWLYKTTPPELPKTTLKIIPIKLVTQTAFMKQGQKNTLAVASSDKDRGVLDRGPKLLFGVEGSTKKDFIHHRASGLNQVHCNIAKRKNITIGFSFNLVLNVPEEYRGEVMGRMMQNILLCRKYKTPFAIGSFATIPFEMRDPKDLQTFFVQLGMHPAEAKQAMKGI